MNIGFDIDDTISRCPGFFSLISRALLDAGHKVTIITFREDREFAEEDLAEFGMVYSELVLPAEGEYRRIIDGDWKDEVGRWKAQVCREKGVDVLFDDMPEVINALDDTTQGCMSVIPSLGAVRYDR